MKLLEIQSSVRQDRSVSRTLASKFIYQWRSYNPDTQYSLRDVGVNAVVAFLFHSGSDNVMRRRGLHI